MIRVLHVEPNKEPAVVFINNTLKDMCDLVDKDNCMLQIIKLDENVFLYLDDDGIRKELLQNRWLSPYGTLLGPFFIQRIDEEGDSISLTDNDVDRWTKKFALSQSRIR